MDESPTFVRISTAAAMTIKIFPGQFNRGEKLGCLNLLIHYEDGCKANCSYCGLSHSRDLQAKDPSEDTFIRVDWPLVGIDEIIYRAKRHAPHLQRVCVSMITHEDSFEDMLTIMREFRDKTDLAISGLIAPTMMLDKETAVQIKEAGADMIGVAIDAATPEIFDEMRGSGVMGPHNWEHYWQVLDWCVDVFGKGMVGIHIIVGLGETEEEMVSVIQHAQNKGAKTHLFSFFPEGGSAMDGWLQPSYGRYRRIQLARYVINEGLGDMSLMKFDSEGQLIDFGININPIVNEGFAFMTSGCAGSDGMVACNRPYGNERASNPIRNFAFIPEKSDIKTIWSQIFDYIE
ncbi:MAG: radical SAM protein [Thermoplasmata archaeon]|nr:radical SAM protein [Thermoplasmata archaeon]